MAPFDKYMNKYQTEWRRNNVTSQEWGRQNGRRYSWILLQDLWEEGLWPGIRSGSDNSLPAYLERTGVQKHRGVHNLKSSWVMCANLYFPFGASADGRDLFAAFLKRYASEKIDSLEVIELEHAEAGELSPPQLLGELGGMRGANQTSPDLGLLVNGGRGLVLVENKCTEHSCYECSAWRYKGSSRRPGNPDPDRCLNPLEVAENPSKQCHQAAWGRRYWEHLATVVDRETLIALPRCPAARHGYQLFRQQAQAEGIARSGQYALVVSAVAVDERNNTLTSRLRRSGFNSLEHWGRLFRGKAGFALFTHQQWTTWVREHDIDGRWSDWLEYVSLRYGLSGQINRIKHHPSG